MAPLLGNGRNRSVVTLLRDLRSLVSKIRSYDRINKVTFSLLFVLSSLLGVLAFWPPKSLELLLNLSAGLVGLTGATFAIIGVWLTLLNPLAVFDPHSTQDEYKKALVDKLQPFFKLSIVTFAGAVFFRILFIIVPEVLQNLGRWAGVQFPDGVAGVIQSLARSLSGGALIYLFVVQILVILVNLIPLFDAENEEEKEKWEQGIQARKGETYHE